MTAAPQLHKPSAPIPDDSEPLTVFSLVVMALLSIAMSFTAGFIVRGAFL